MNESERKTLTDAEAAGDAPQTASAAENWRINERGEIVVPLVAEQISVGKKTVETGGVRISKTVGRETKTIDEPIVREHLDVERVEVNKFVETAPVVRYEGDVMIVPVLEEVIVTEKKLFLREEIRLVRRREEISNRQEVSLLREEIHLERIVDADDPANAPPNE